MSKRNIVIILVASIAAATIVVAIIGPISGRLFASDASNESSRNANRTVALQLVKAIDLPQVHGRIDHMSMDIIGKRLFIAELGNNSVDIINVTTGQRIHTIAGLSEPQGVLFTPKSDKIIVSNGGDGTVAVYDGSSYSLIKSLKLGDDVDNIRYDSSSGHIYVGYGDGALAVLDSNFSHIADIPLSGHPEAFEISQSANRIFINIPSDHTIAVVDKTTNKVITKWDLGSQSDNFPMALDDHSYRLFVGFRSPAAMVVYDTQSGKPIANLAIPNDADDIYYDNSTKQVYVSGGEGLLDVFMQVNPDQYNEVAKIDTAQGARTSLFVSQLHTLYIASPESLMNGAKILVYQIQ